MMELDTNLNAGQQTRCMTSLRRLVLCLLLLPSVVYGSIHEQLFILHSYSQEYPWTREQHNGFTTSYLADINKQTLISTEYLDTKRISYNPSYADFFAQYLKQKYINYQPKVVYVTDDNALNFAIDHIDKIFPRAKVIFSGVNDFKILDRLDSSRFTGVFEKKEILPNIDLLRLLEPDFSEILVVGDNSTTYQVIEHEIRQQLRKQPGIKAHYIASKSIEQLTIKLKQSKQKYLFLTTIGSITDQSGHQLNLKEIIRQITTAGDFIIISMEDAYIFDGVLGGYVTNGKLQGQTAATLTLALQKGKDISQLAPVTNSPNSYLFDYRELKKNQLKLPPDILNSANILHRPASFYEKNRTLILASIAVLIALLLLSMAIFLHLLARKNKKIQSTSDEMTNQAHALESTKKSLNEAQRLAKVGSWELDLLTNQLVWSDEIFHMFEVNKEQFGASYEAFLNTIHPEDLDMVNKAYSDSLVNRQPYEIRHRLKMSNGDIKYVNETCETSFDDNGKPLRSMGTVQDITELHKIETELSKHRDHLEKLVSERTAELEIARDEAERANAIKSEFLARMSHELRTPMNAILGFGQILEMNNEGFNEIQNANVREILDAGYHLLHLINEVLDLAKIESGKLHISIEDVPVDDVMQQCISLIQPQADASKIELIDNVSGQGHHVQADHTRLKQIIVNLLSNAVKYNCDNGCTTLDSEIIDNQRLRIHVTDTGQGLTEEEISTLFIPFERLNAVNNIEGTGIGLVITKHLIEAMGGVIGVNSTPGEGCSFWIEIALFNES